MKILLPILILVLLFTSCSTTETDCICTEEFRFYTVTILDEKNLPIDSLDIEVKNKESGYIYNIDQSNFTNKGDYIVMDDSQRQILCTCDQTVLFIAHNNSVHIEEEFSFYVDNCRCHVYKSSGPDTIKAY